MPPDIEPLAKSGVVQGTGVAVASLNVDEGPSRSSDTVELQGYFRVADGNCAADHTSFWGCKIG